MSKSVAKAVAISAAFLAGVTFAQPLSIPCPWDGAMMLPTYNTQQGVKGLLYEFRCTLDNKHASWVPQ